MFVLNLVTPEKKLVTELEIEELLVPGFKGQLGILPGHAPLVTTLTTGILKYRTKGSSTYSTFVVSWGYCEVHPGGVTVLAEVAQSLEEIDRARAEEALKKARAKLADPLIDLDQLDAMRRKIERNENRLAALGIDSNQSH